MNTQNLSGRPRGRKILRWFVSTGLETGRPVQRFLPRHPRWICRLAAFAALVGCAVIPSLLANPTGESVRHGQATFTRSGSNLIIEQGSDKLVVNWKDFSISSAEITKFIQPGASSSALNRVLGGTRSLLDGRLEANGQVILINPAGITVGPNGVVNVNSFIGSTLDITDEEFLAGNALRFQGASEADITVLGTIHAETGDIHLLAKSVVNEGVLDAPNGTVGLAAASDVVLQPDGDEKLFIQPSSSKGGTVVNKGAIRAATAEIKAVGNPYALAINLEGVVSAQGSASKPQGKVRVSGGEGNVRVAASVKARNSNRSGGQVAVNKAGGSGDVEVSGAIDTRGDVGSGGAIELFGRNVSLAAGSLLDAGGSAAGGLIHVHATEALQASGAVLASGQSATGGVINLLGKNILLASTFLADASGAAGGGKIFVGGDYFGGRDPETRYSDQPLPTAENLTVAAGATLRADALQSGNGGTVIQWSDGTTQSFGSVSVRGGPSGGNGGFAEISGGQNLAFDGTVNLEAPNGAPGVVLFDPSNLVIQNGNGTLNVNLPNILPNTGSGFQSVSVSALEAISAGHIFLRAQGFGGTSTSTDGIQVADLTLNGGDGELNLQTGVSLTMETVDGVIQFVNSLNAVIASGSGTITLNTPTSGGSGALLNIGRLQSDTGTITLLGGDGITLAAPIVTHGGNVYLDADSDQGTVGIFTLNSAAPITTNGGSIFLKAGSSTTSNTLIVNAPIDLGSGSITFSGTNGGGRFALGATISASGNFDVTQPLTMNAGAGITTSGTITFTNTVTMANGGSLTLRSEGVDFSAATFLDEANGALLLEPFLASSNVLIMSSDSGGGAYDLPSATMSKVASFGSLTIGRPDGTGTFTVAADFSIQNPLTLLAPAGGTLDLNKKITGTTTDSNITILMGPQLTISTGGQVATQATGNSVVLSAHRFINSVGASAFQVPGTPNRRWLVYSNNPADDVFGGLNSGNTALWGRTIQSAPAASITQTGNRYVFAVQPVLTVSSSDSTKTYGQGSGPLPYSVSGWVTETHGGAFLADTPATAYSGVPIVESPGAVPTAPVAPPYPINISQGTLSSPAGYGFLFDPTAQLTVAPKSITVTALGGTSTYGDSPANPGLSANGLVNGQDTSVLTGLSNSFGISNFSDAGTYALSVSGALTNPNYMLLSVDSSNWVVNPKGIAVTALGGTSTYGDSPANPGLSATGLVNGQTTSVLTGLSNNFGVTNLSNAGTYALAMSGALTNTNYTVLNANPGFWTVAPKGIEVTALGGTSTYGDSPANPGLSATGLVNGQTASVLTGLTNSFGISNLSNAATYALTVNGALGNANYVVQSRVGTNWVVDPRGIVVSALGGTSMIGESPANPGLQILGGTLANNDTLNSLGFTNAFGITSSTAVGSYALLVNGSAANYLLTKLSGQWLVNQRPVIAPLGVETPAVAAVIREASRAVDRTPSNLPTLAEQISQPSSESLAQKPMPLMMARKNLVLESQEPVSIEVDGFARALPSWNLANPAKGLAQVQLWGDMLTPTDAEEGVR